MTHFAAIASPINDIADSLGANNLPYAIPLHPNLVHLTIGLFAIAIAFDVAGAFYPLEKRVFRYLALPVTRSGFHDVGWYNLVACSGISFFTVAAGFYEMLLAVPLPGIRNIFGQTAIDTMLWHAIGGVAILLVIVAMTIWRGYQRFVWRKDLGDGAGGKMVALSRFVALSVSLTRKTSPTWLCRGLPVGFPQ